MTNSKAMKSYYKTKAGKKHAKETSMRSKDLWKDKDYRKKHRNFLDPEKNSERMTKKWADPKFACRMKQARLDQCTPDRNKANSERMKALWADPEYRAHQTTVRQQNAKTRCVAAGLTQRKRILQGYIKTWNKGLTKNDHPSIMRVSRKLIGRVPQRKLTPYLVYQKGNRVVEMRSWWEVAYAEYLDRKGIRWEYEPRWFNVGSSKKWKGVSYTPDFYLIDKNYWIEIKGLADKKFKAKFAEFKKRYPSVGITVFTRKELRAKGVLDNNSCAILSAEGRRNRKKHKRVLAKAKT